MKTFINLNEIDMAKPEAELDLTALRARLKDKTGPSYWRSLEELADTPEFKNFLDKEFPASAYEETGKVTRRNFLRLMGASLAMAGLTACLQRPREIEAIVPYVRQPEEVVPGRSLYFASSLTLGGYASGVLVESHLGRPTKIEGNPEHPASLGATDPIMQAEVLTLYDPDRSQSVRFRGEESTWESFLGELEGALANLGDGTGFYLLTETITSPSLAAQLQAVLDRFPGALWYQYDPAHSDSAYGGAELAFGEVVHPVYNFADTDVILSLDADFLGQGPGRLRYARDFTDRRRIAAQDAAGQQLSSNRLYAVESTPGLVGVVADHHYTLPPSQIEGLARAVATSLGLSLEGGTPVLPEAVAAWVEPLARDLQAHGGRSLVIAGPDQPAAVHTIAHAINDALGNVGSTVTYTDPPEVNPVPHMLSLRELSQAMGAGQVQALVILGGNPAFTAPADIDFAAQLANVPLTIHAGLYEDETAVLCGWHIPLAHELEAWGDARAFDGTVSLMQPLIAPLYGGRSPHEILAALAGDTASSNYDLVRGYWQGQAEGDFDTFWRRAVHDGFVEGSALPAREVSLQEGALASPPSVAAGAGLEVIFKPDPSLHDGRYANNAWLQELPKPLTKLVWDNAVLIAPATAEEQGVRTGDMVTLSYLGREIEAPVFILPGHPQNTITLHYGYGRTQTGRVGTGTGFNAFALRTSDAPGYGSGLQLSRTGGRYMLVTTQDHNRISLSRNLDEINESGQAAYDRHLVRYGTLEQYVQDPGFVYRMGHEPLGSLYPGYDYTQGYAWGMAIDLNTCIACNACVVACQSENNIPTVGKDEVRRGREMHWIRIDRYFTGDIDHPHVYHQPMLCQHCENAPCEVVCPVGATVHSSEGLNDMVYNRCVGTRYCSNNCPYKVRRFNFFHYTRLEDNVLDLLRNPNVTVRSRGVMEKCTYCVQRINRARIDAENQSRRIQDGEVVPACAAACPGRAIVFGDLNDPNSLVRQYKGTALNYGVLAELNTQPRTSYLARITNPNPELSGEPVEQHAEQRAAAERA